MFKSAATKIAHNTTIPALAGNSDLRPLQDLITAEKTVLMSLQKLRVDLSKAGDALRIWGQGEGDDLGDILTASSMILGHFAAAISTYSSLHHTVRDSMKSVRTREEALDELRRRRRRVGASAEAAEKKLNKMSPEHKNLAMQADALNKLRDEMRALDGEIVREETELGDYKRKCAKDWMGFKFGGLVECCEKGVIVGEVGRQIIQSIPEDVTQPGLPRVYYSAHGHVGDLVAEAQRAVSQVAFSGSPTGHTTVSPPITQGQPPTSQEPVQSPFLPTPSLGSELTLGVATYNPPPGPPPARKRASVDELGLHTQTTHAPPPFSSLPTNTKERGPAPAPASSSLGPAARPLSLSVPYDNGVAQTEENQSLMASIADALSQSHRGFSLEEATSTVGHAAPDDGVRKFDPNVARSAQSEPHGPVANGHVGSPRLTEETAGQRARRATRRSTSPPNLPPGAAPAAIRAWDDRMGQGEDGTHSDHPASSSASAPSQHRFSSSDPDGEEEPGLAYESNSLSLDEEGTVGGDGNHAEHTSFSQSGGEGIVGAITAISNEQGTLPIQSFVSADPTSLIGNTTSLSRTESQWRIPRVPPPTMDAPQDDIHAAAHDQEGDEIRTDESADARARNEAAAREVSRAMDALMFSSVSPPITSGHATPRAPPPGYGSAFAVEGQAHPYMPPTLPPSSTGRGQYDSTPPSPILPPNPPFANRGRTSPPLETRHFPGHRQTPSQSVPVHVPTPQHVVTTPAAGVAGPSISPGSASPIYRSPPPEYPRPTPPFSTNLMASSTSSLNSGAGGTSPGGGPRTISAAAFRRQQARSPSGTETLGPADTSPLTLRKPSGSPLPSLPPQSQSGSRSRSGSGSVSLGSVPLAGRSSKASLSVVNPDARMSDEDDGRGEFDHVGVHGGESAGYAAGRYVSDLERDG